MKLTGLITIRGYGRFIDINQNEIDAVGYVLKTYSNYSQYASESDYFNYMSQVDPQLKSLLLAKNTIIIKSSRDDLLKWVGHYDWETIKDELVRLAENRSSTDDVLKFIDKPLRLEFLTSLAIISQIDNIDVIPNYIVDDEGLPSSHAPGNGADIECREADSDALVEVTLLTGTAQHKNESFSVTRHLDEYIKHGGKNAYALFISPKIFVDTMRYFRNIKTEENLEIKYSNIPDFVIELETCNTLREVAFSKT